MAYGTFATAINCMDGRVQEPVIRWMKERFKVDYVDMITEPGPDKILTTGPTDAVQAIRRRVDISLRAHGSRVFAVVAHHDCAGYPVSKQQHLAAVGKSVDIIRSWDGTVRVLGLWVDETWQIEVVADSLEE